MKKIDIYAKGIVACSICSPKEKSIEDIEVEVNAELPTGISSQWKIANENFMTGEKNPHECENDKDRLHYLLKC
ncbi:MAG: hypothetical protein V4509_05250 [Patescibacteria group bacterium]